MKTRYPTLALREKDMVAIQHLRARYNASTNAQVIRMAIELVYAHTRRALPGLEYPEKDGGND